MYLHPVFLFLFDCCFCLFFLSDYWILFGKASLYICSSSVFLLYGWSCTWFSESASTPPAGFLLITTALFKTQEGEMLIYGFKLYKSFTKGEGEGAGEVKNEQIGRWRPQTQPVVICLISPPEGAHSWGDGCPTTQMVSRSRALGCWSRSSVCGTACVCLYVNFKCWSSVNGLLFCLSVWNLAAP